MCVKVLSCPRGLDAAAGQGDDAHGQSPRVAKTREDPHLATDAGREDTEKSKVPSGSLHSTANLRTKIILDFRGLDSSMILI